MDVVFSNIAKTQA
jgi:hypothetical protein